MLGGFVYAIGTAVGEPVKIGSTTKTVASRLQQIQTSHHAPLTVFASVSVDENVMDIERTIHHILHVHRLHGEWFNVEMSQILLEELVTEARQAIEQRKIIEQQNIEEESQREIEEKCSLLHKNFEDAILTYRYALCDDVEVEIAIHNAEYCCEDIKETREFIETLFSE